MKDNPLFNEEKHDIKFWLEHWLSYYNKINAFESEFYLMNGDEKILVCTKTGVKEFVPICGDEIFKVDYAECHLISDDTVDNNFGFSCFLNLIGHIDGVTVDTSEKEKDYFLTIDFRIKQVGNKLNIFFICDKNLNNYEIISETIIRKNFERIVNSENPKIVLEFSDPNPDGTFKRRELDKHNTKLITCVLVSFLRNVAVSCCPNKLLQDKGELRQTINTNKHKNFGTW